MVCLNQDAYKVYPLQLIDIIFKSVLLTESFFSISFFPLFSLVLFCWGKKKTGLLVL